MKQQIVIVGGGVAGIVSALTAEKLGFNVILIEQQKNIGQYLHYGPTNKLVTYDDPKYCQLMPCGTADYSKLWFEDFEYVANNQDVWIERWNEWLAG